MNLYKNSEKKPVHLVLAKDRVRNLKRGYPWIFSHYLEKLPKADSGSLAILKDKTGEILAKGFYDPESPLAFRVFALGKENIDDALIIKRIENAISLRRLLFDDRTTGFRLINGEGDGLPGLVCDVYGDTAVMQFDGAGPRNFYQAKGIAEIISKSLHLKKVYRKARRNEDGTGEALIGDLPSDATLFLENGVKFSVDIIKGQKTGFFLDQRENRQRIGKLTKNKTVLNLFGYTGGFSIYAGINGATKVTTMDLAKPAIAAANENWILNNLDPKLHDGIAEDAFSFLEDAKSKKLIWDVVIVDPPSFAHSADSVEDAKKSYHRLFTAALLAVAKGGIIATSSCSSHIDQGMFLEICQEALSTTRRRGTLIGLYGQPEDHPYPLACSDLCYLKFAMIGVE